MKKRTGTQSITGLAALLTFGVFAVCILSVLLSGAGTYRRLTERNQASYDYRTCSQYIAAKVHQAPSSEALSVSDFDGNDALAVAEEIDGVTYLTHIYCYDGWICELFAEAGGDFAPSDGQQVMQAQSLSLSLDGGLLSVEIVDPNGKTVSLLLSVRGEEAES